MNIIELYEIYKQYPSIQTDTRKLKKGDIFFALRGPNFNANAFALAALESGATYAVIDDPEYNTHGNMILVTDALAALQQLALFHRNQFDIPFIAITGSNGKTTTKELIHAVLSSSYKTYTTEGNLNNHIGVPLTILKIRSDAEMAVIEMGANHRGEIASYCDYTRPTHGLITNVGKAHLEGFGGFDGVKQAKGELYAYLAANNGIAFVNRDNSILSVMVRQHDLTRISYYGTGKDNDISGELIENTPLTVTWSKNNTDQSENKTTSNLTGSYNLENILAAVCVGTYFGLSDQKINQGISGYFQSNNRSQLTKTDTNMLICDFYNANPSSMAVALENLASINAVKKTIILGDMFELGKDAEEEHKLIVSKALEARADRTIFIGKEFYALKTQEAEFYPGTEEAIKHLKDNPITGSTILIKGSRGMKFETMISLF